MENIYGVICNRLTNTGVAISENVGRWGKFRHGATPRRKASLAAGSLAVAAFAQAGQSVDNRQPQIAAHTLSPCVASACEVGGSVRPIGGQVVSGIGSISESGNSTTIRQSSADLTIDWVSFNIGSQETVNFLQPSASAVAVNQIFSTNGSTILGHLDANGQVWLINPNGVLFGRGAQVDVGGLVASTLNVSDLSASGNTTVFSGNGPGSIVNQGTIDAANGGYVALLGNHSSNQGTITAKLGTVALAAGSATTLTFSGNSLAKMQVDQSTLKTLAENGGLIQADGGTVIMSAGAKNALLASVVNNTGIIEARAVENHDGTIELLGGMTAGTVNVGGTLDASAPTGGNGGFIETDAAHVEIAKGANVTTLATTGKTGTWLIDPTDFTVAPSGGDLTGATLSSNLSSTNTTILSSNGTSPVTGGGSGGNININDTISWSANTTLTLTAANNVNVNANMTATGNTAGLVINPNTANGSQAASGSGAFNLNLGNSITLSGTNPNLSIAGNAYTVINTLGAAGSTTGADLQGINGNLSGYYALGSNIDATATSSWNSGAGFTPIGNSSMQFAGSFNGLGHTISNLSINLPSADFLGLFGYTGTGAVIQNVGLVGGSVSGSQGVGGLVGVNNGTVSNSYATGSMSGFAFVGGLVGYSSGSVTDSYATGSVSGTVYVGGLVGQNNNTGIISNSYATGSVSGTSSSDYVGGLVGITFGPVSNSYATGSVSGFYGVGGLVGYNNGTYNSGSVTDSYATGSVSGSSNVGGLVGYNTSPVSNSYATGSVSGTSSVGGLVGYNGGTVNNSFWDTSTSGQTTSAGGTGLTTSQMQTASSFTGFNFTTTPSAPGNNWVIVDTDGTLNNAGDAAGATFPMLASEYATTINNAHQLQLIAMNLAASYTLGQNIEASRTGNSSDVWGSSGFVPIGGYTTHFTGTFDGLGHTISNLTINLLGNYAGLFGAPATPSVIENVGLVGGSVAGNLEVGGLVGANFGGTIGNSYSTATVTGYGEVGGLVGYNVAGTITNSYAAGNVSGIEYVGGLAGFNNYFTTINKSYATGNVSGLSGSTNVGGLVGWNEGTVSNSYATGSVSGTEYVGGLVGINDEYATLSNSFATGTVTGSSNTQYVGGLVGYNVGTVSKSFWDMTTSGQTTSAGGTGLTDSQMRDAASFTGWSIATSGGSGDLWRIYQGNTYPLLTSFLTPLTLTDAPDATVTYNGASQSGPTTAISGVLGAAATGTNAGFYNGYYSTQQGYDITGGNLTINPASLTLSGSRVYDGTTIIAGSVLTATGVAGQTFSVLGAGDPSNLTSKNVQTDITLATTTGLSLGSSSNGGLSSNYEPLSTSGSSITITPLALTGVSIGSASSTYGATVTPGAVSFSNVIPGDVVTSLANILNPLYSTSGNLRAGSFAQTAYGLTGADASDYTFAGYTTPTNNYAVAPLALTGAAIAAGSTIYGSTVTPGAVSFSNVIAGDVVSSTASIASPAYSTSRHLDAGSYYQTASGLSGVDAGNYSFAGGFTTSTQNYTVAQLALNVTGLTGTSRVYNGSTVDTLHGTASIAPLDGDAVHLSGTGSGSFASANVGTAVPVTVTGYSLTGSDAGNYLLVEPTALTANITRLASVAWVGGASGNWSLASNWAGGAIPDYANVAAVTIPSGDTVTYDSGVPGATTLTTLTNTGNLVMAAGNLFTTGNVSTAGYQQTGGALSVGGSLTINPVSGGVSLGAIKAGSLSINSPAGAITQLAATTLDVTGTSTLTAPNNSITLANASDIFGGAVSSSGSTIDLYQSTGGLKLGATTATGNFTADANAGAITQTAGVTVDGTGSLIAHSAITLSNAANDFVGAVSANGSAITLDNSAALTASVTSTGATALASAGALNVSGTVGTSLTTTTTGTNSATTFDANTAVGTNLGVTSTGPITQLAATTLGVIGTSTLTAPNNNITLANATNKFVGAVASNGLNIDLVDGTSGLMLGNSTATGTFTADSLAGTIRQAASTAVNVTGTSTLTANNGGTTNYAITLANTSNSFEGTVTATGSAITLDDTAPLTAVLDGTGASALASAGALNVSGRVGTSLTTTTTGTGSATNFGATTVGTTLVASSAGAITQSASTAMDVTGTTNLTAPGYGITLANATNSFGSTVTSNGSNIDLVQSTGGLKLGNTTATGTLTVTSMAGAITQSGGAAIDVTGTTGLTANNGVTGAGAVSYGITLANTSNDFVGAVTSQGSNVNILDTSTGGLILGNTTATGTLTATSRGGAITQTASTAVDAIGTSTLSANNGVAGMGAVSYGITLANATNDFVGAITSNGANITLLDTSSGGLLLGATTASGTLTATSRAGAITQSGAAVVTGTTSLTANNGISGAGAVNYGITLTKATNDFGGAVTATGSAITLDDAVALTATLDGTGASSLTSAGSLDVSGMVGTSLTTKTTGNDSATTFGATTVGTKLGVTSTGPVTETSTNILTVDGEGTSTVSNPNVTVNGVKGAEIPL
jgi:filamentous hemagglutinin family protein